MSPSPQDLDREIADAERKLSEVAQKLKEQTNKVKAAKEFRQRADNAFGAYIPQVERRLNDHIKAMTAIGKERDQYRDTNLGAIRERLPIADRDNETKVNNKATNGYLKKQMRNLYNDRLKNWDAFKQYNRMQRDNTQLHEYFQLDGKNNQDDADKQKEIMKQFRVQYQSEVAKMGRMQSVLNEDLAHLRTLMTDRNVEGPVPPASYGDVVRDYQKKYPEDYAKIQESYEKLQELKDQRDAAKNNEEINSINQQIIKVGEDPILEFYTKEEYELTKIIRNCQNQESLEDKAQAGLKENQLLLMEKQKQLLQSKLDQKQQGQAAIELQKRQTFKTAIPPPGMPRSGRFARTKQDLQGKKTSAAGTQNASEMLEPQETAATSVHANAAVGTPEHISDKDLEAQEASQAKSTPTKTGTQSPRTQREQVSDDFNTADHQEGEGIEQTEGSGTIRQPSKPGAQTSSMQRSQVADDFNPESREAVGGGAPDDKKDNGIEARRKAMLDVKKAMEKFVHQVRSEVFNFKGGQLLRDKAANDQRKLFLTELAQYNQTYKLGIDLSLIPEPLKKLEAFEAELRDADKLNLDRQADHAEIFAFKQRTDGRSLVQERSEANKLFKEFYAKKSQTTGQTPNEHAPTGTQAISKNSVGQREKYRDIGTHTHQHKVPTQPTAAQSAPGRTVQLDDEDMSATQPHRAPPGTNPHRISQSEVQESEKSSSSVFPDLNKGSKSQSEQQFLVDGQSESTSQNFSKYKDKYQEAVKGKQEQGKNLHENDSLPAVKPRRS